MFNFADIAARHTLAETTIREVAATLQQIYTEQSRGNTSEAYERFVSRLSSTYDAYFETLEEKTRRAATEMARERYDYTGLQDEEGDEFDDNACPLSGIDSAYCHCGRHE